MLHEDTLTVTFNSLELTTVVELVMARLEVMQCIPTPTHDEQMELALLSIFVDQVLEAAAGQIITRLMAGIATLDNQAERSSQHG